MQPPSTLSPAAARLLAVSAAWLARKPGNATPAAGSPGAAARNATSLDDDPLIDEAHADDGPLPPRPLRLHRARLRALWLAQGDVRDAATL